MDDPFALLGLEPTFQLDLDLAERRHLKLSAALHPDRHAGAPASQRRQVLNQAIAVNQAYRALRDPVTRAETLLARLGIASPEEGQPQADTVFLMDMVERRENLSEARHARDTGRIKQLTDEVRSLRDETLAYLGSEFDRALRGNPQVSSQALLTKVGELRFYSRFIEEARAAEDDLD